MEGRTAGREGETQEGGRNERQRGGGRCSARRPAGTQTHRTTQLSGLEGTSGESKALPRQGHLEQVAQGADRRVWNVSTPSPAALSGSATLQGKRIFPVLR